MEFSDRNQRHVGIFGLLLKQDVNVNLTNRFGETPLLYAVENGNLRFVEVLLENGADINREDRRWRTPLWHAINLGKSDVAGFLLEKNARLHPGDFSKYTALGWAARNGWSSMVKILVENQGLVFDYQPREGPYSLYRWYVLVHSKKVRLHNAELG